MLFELRIGTITVLIASIHTRVYTASGPALAVWMELTLPLVLRDQSPLSQFRLHVRVCPAVCVQEDTKLDVVHVRAVYAA